MLGPQLSLVDRHHVLFRGKKLLYFAGTDYHRLSSHRDVIQAAVRAAEQYGLNPGGSRTTTGNHPLYARLEEKIARFFESESATVFASGYLSNLIALQAVAHRFTHFFIDEQAHSSITDATSLFSQPAIFFRHLDAEHLQTLLNKHATRSFRPLVLTDGVFPSRGEMAPLQEYINLVQPYEGKVLVDDAHAMAVAGATGKGSWEALSVDRSFIYQTGTLSKGFGAAGGIIPGTRQLIHPIHQKSLAFSGSTGLALPMAAAALRALELIQQHPEWIGSLQQTALELKSIFQSMGFDLPLSPTPIFSLTFYNTRKNNKFYHHLIEKGIYPPYIHYPGAPEGGHFRFVVTSAHTREHIERLIDAVQSFL